MEGAANANASANVGASASVGASVGAMPAAAAAVSPGPGEAVTQQQQQQPPHMQPVPFAQPVGPSYMPPYAQPVPPYAAQQYAAAAPNGQPMPMPMPAPYPQPYAYPYVPQQQPFAPQQQPYAFPQPYAPQQQPYAPVQYAPVQYAPAQYATPPLPRATTKFYHGWSKAAWASVFLLAVTYLLFTLSLFALPLVTSNSYYYVPGYYYYGTDVYWYRLVAQQYSTTTTYVIDIRGRITGNGQSSTLFSSPTNVRFLAGRAMATLVFCVMTLTLVASIALHQQNRWFTAPASITPLRIAKAWIVCFVLQVVSFGLAVSIVTSTFGYDSAGRSISVQPAAFAISLVGLVLYVRNVVRQQPPTSPVAANSGFAPVYAAPAAAIELQSVQHVQYVQHVQPMQPVPQQQVQYVQPVQQRAQ